MRAHIDAVDLPQGLRHGPATYFHSNGSKEEATYDEGYETGPSVVLFASGKREERSYVNGVLSGPAVIYGTDGDKFEFQYREEFRSSVCDLCTELLGIGTLSEDGTKQKYCITKADGQIIRFHNRRNNRCHDKREAL